MTSEELTAPLAPKVRVGIVSWNTADLLGRCLASLPAATEGLEVEVVVVDNASSDASAEVAERMPGVRVVRNADNVGYAKAMNQALLIGDGAAGIDVLIALNPDTEPVPGSLARLVTALLTDDSVGLAVPRLTYPDGTLQHSVYRFPGPRVSAATCFVPRAVLDRGLGAALWLEGFATHDVEADIDWAIGAVHAIRTSALAGKAPYNERWFMYVEDLDLCWELWHSGWRIRLAPDVEVVHIGNASGAIAWGNTRTGRWTDATYDWYRLRHGGVAVRWWAAVNTAAACSRVLVVCLRRLLGRRLQPWDRDLIRVVPHHVRHIVRRSRPR